MHALTYAFRPDVQLTHYHTANPSLSNLNQYTFTTRGVTWSCREHMMVHISGDDSQLQLRMPVKLMEETMQIQSSGDL